MDHDTVGACLDESECSCESVVHTLFEDKALDTCDYHEVIGELCSLAGSDLSAHFLNCSLCLLYLGTEEGVLLQALLVLDDNSAYAHSFEGTYCVNEMLGKSACIAVEDDRLGCNFHDVVDSAET